MAYFLAVAFKSSTSTATKDFAADVTLKKTSGQDNTVDKKDLKFDRQVDRYETDVKYGDGSYRRSAVRLQSV
jgi:hypothetical protein